MTVTEDFEACSPSFLFNPANFSDSSYNNKANKKNVDIAKFPDVFSRYKNKSCPDKFPTDSNGNDIAGLLSSNPEPAASEGTTSTIGTVFLIVNAALGAGLLNLPKAFDEAGGVLTAVGVQASLLVFIVLALMILAQTANINKSTTLQEVMFTCSGVWGRRATSTVVTVYCFGTCITFLIIIGDQFDRAFASLVGTDFCNSWYFNRSFVMPISSLLVILPMCYSKKIDFLKYASAFGVFIIIYVVALIIVEYVSGDHIPGPVKASPNHWTDVFGVIPVICFGYQCHVSVVPIYSCMRHRNLKHFSVASITAIAICVMAYTVAATFGYLTFGSQVSEDILSNYDAQKPSVMIALVALGLKTFTTYPILLFCGREGLSSLIKDSFVKEDSPTKERIRRSTIATVWFVTTVIIAIAIPNIGAVIHVLGSLAAIFIFVFPGVCLLQVTLMRDYMTITMVSKLKLILAFSFIILGFFLFGVVLTQGIMVDLHQASRSKSLCTTEGGGVNFWQLL